MFGKKEKEIILKYCLQNAVFYNGKANANAVLGKVLKEKPELKKNIKELGIEIGKTVKKINTMRPDEQRKMLEKIDSHLLEKEVKKKGLPELKNAKIGKVVTRLAPSPTGALHISHLPRAVFLSWLYAKKYKGKFLLRFEDTDAKKVQKEFYNWILDDLKSLGIKPDGVYKQSERIEIYYKHAEKLLKTGLAYVCFCSADKFRKLKKLKKECSDRKNSREKNLLEWKNMLAGKYNEGDVVVRLKTSMNEKNPVLRDPPLLRISKDKHPLTGTKYKVWPLYNFACIIDDHLLGVTHVFRGKEHEHNTAVQAKIAEAFNWKPPTTLNFGMIHLPGVSMHKREIREGIKNGVYTGWDDIKLPTVKSLLRRGYQPKTFEELAIQTSLSKTDIKLGWENLNGINRKIIDPIANRYAAVINPVKIKIIGMPKIKEIIRPLHPDFPKRGTKKIPIDLNKIWISKEDYKNLQGKNVRLIGLFNIKLKDRKAVYTGNEILKGMQKIQFVSTPNVKINIIRPDSKLSGIGEPELKKLKLGSIVQFERIGFARFDCKKNNIYEFWFTHK